MTRYIYRAQPRCFPLRTSHNVSTSLYSGISTQSFHNSVYFFEKSWEPAEFCESICAPRRWNLLMFDWNCERNMRLEDLAQIEEVHRLSHVGTRKNKCRIRPHQASISHKFPSHRHHHHHRRPDSCLIVKMARLWINSLLKGQVWIYNVPGVEPAKSIRPIDLLCNEYTYSFFQKNEQLNCI